MWDFLLGPDRLVDISYVQIGPRVYDIDVVEGVASLLEQDLAVRDDELRIKYEQNPARPVLMPDALPSVSYPVRVEVLPRDIPGAALAAARAIPLGDVAGLSASERSRLVVYGAEAQVNFGRTGLPMISTTRPELQNALEQYLRTEGRRQVDWRRLTALLPVIAGVALVPLWIVATFEQHLEVATALFGYILAAGGATAGWLATRLILRSSLNRVRGHRFREVTREEFRTSLSNTKAGIITSAGGTLLGVLLTVFFYYVTGINPA